MGKVMATCEHDYDNAKRISRAKWICPKCDKDISFTVYLLEELFMDIPDKVETAKRIEKWIKAKDEDPLSIFKN